MTNKTTTQATGTQLSPLAVIQQHFLKDQVMKKIAKHCNTDVDGVESIVRDLTNAIRSSQDKELIYCTPQSFVNCIYNAHALKMRIDARQHCYLVRYGSEATLAPSYKGYVNRLKASLEGFDIQTFIWFEEGEFIDKSKDGLATYEYNPKPKNRSRSDYHNAVGCAVYISYWQHGEKKAVVEVIGREEMSKIKSKAKTSKVWDEWFGEQMKKAVVRRACKLRFSMITDDLDALDNDHYDLEGVPESARAKPVDRFNEKMNSEKYNPFPGEQGPIVDAVVVEDPEGGADPAKKEPEKAGNQQETSTEGTAPTSGEAPPADPWDGVVDWQGGMWIDGKPINKDFSSLNGAYTYLVTCVSKRKSAKSRFAILEENKPLLKALHKDNLNIYQSLIELAQKGEPDVPGQTGESH